MFPIFGREYLNRWIDRKMRCDVMRYEHQDLGLT